MPTHPVRNPIAEFYQRRTPTQWALIGSLVAFLLLGYAVWDAFRDDPPPDISDLLIDVQPVPDEENGMVLLEEIGNELDRIDVEPHLDDLVLLPDPDEPRDWEAIGQKLELMKAPLARLPEVFSRPAFQAQIIWDFEASDRESAKGLKIIRTLSARCVWANHEGRYEDAWQDVLLLLEIGKYFRNGETTVVGYLVGVSGSTIGLGNLSKMLPDISTDPVATRQRAAILKKYQPSADSLRHLFLIELFMLQSSYRRFVQKLASEQYGPFAPIYYKPNRTTKHFALLLREALKNLDQPLAHMQYPYAQKIIIHGAGPYNYWGNEVAYSRVFSYYLEKVRKLDATFATTRVGLALAGYANQHNGELPEILTALVPDYIDAIPLDPMDGLPLRYNREERKVWSIGKDLIDEGGLPREDVRHNDPHDIVVKIPQLED